MGLYVVHPSSLYENKLFAWPIIHLYNDWRYIALFTACAGLKRYLIASVLICAHFVYFPIKVWSGRQHIIVFVIDRKMLEIVRCNSSASRIDILSSDRTDTINSFTIQEVYRKDRHRKDAEFSVEIESRNGSKSLKFTAFLSSLQARVIQDVINRRLNSISS